MPGDSDSRLGRLTAKLLRRTSSSSSAKNPIPTINSTSTPHPESDHNNTQTTTLTRHARRPDKRKDANDDADEQGHRNSWLHRRRSSFRGSSRAVATPSPSTTVQHQQGPAAEDEEEEKAEAETENKRSIEQDPCANPSTATTNGELDLTSSSSHPCPPPSVSAAVALPSSARRPQHPLPIPTPPLSSSAVPGVSAAAAQTPPAVRKSASKASEFDVEATTPPTEPDIPEGQRAPSAQRNLDDFAFPTLSPDSLVHGARLSRQSTTGSVGAPASPYLLQVVDESGPDNSVSPQVHPSTRVNPSANPSQRPSLVHRRQSLVPTSQQRLIKTLLDPSRTPSTGYFSQEHTPSIQSDMIHRKIWVKRPGCSPTLVVATEEDLVDDLRDAILKKYTNSLGYSFDAPDICIKIVTREPSSRHSQHERVLGPEEVVGRTLDMYYPGGQTVDEALIIDLTQRRTPKPSPRPNGSYRHHEALRPGESGDYFPPMAVVQTPNAPGSISSSSGPSSHHGQPQSMSVIATGQVPPLPSPGSRGSWNQSSHRPKYHRQHTTSSPTMAPAVPSSSMNDHTNPSMNGVPPLPSPPAPATSNAPQPEPSVRPAGTPPARPASPRVVQKQAKMLNINKSSSSGSAPNALPATLLDGTVPPISVLIVEDNSINLKLLEAFMKRLKVRWQTAMNGRDAVDKFRQGGFHLVLMDIQLPVMDGLEATREIRRLERLNGIGVFSKSVSGRRSPSNRSLKPENGSGEDGEEGDAPEDEPLKPEDTLDKQLHFKSPVIVVALTASSLQSDRHEALAAGCNDFLTKPLNIMWLEQKVTEWGCMQALIDFEGWRKWRGFAEEEVKPPNPVHASLLPDARITDSPPAMGGPRRSAAQAPKQGGDLHDIKEGQPGSRGSKGSAANSLSSAGKTSSSASSSSTIVPHSVSASSSVPPRHSSPGVNPAPAPKKTVKLSTASPKTTSA